MIKNSCLGEGGDNAQKMSLNDKQVSTTMEGKNNAIAVVKRNIEEAKKWTNETICKLRYKNKFLSCSVSFGTEFFAYTSEDLRSQYDIAKKMGASEAELDYLQDRLIEVENKNNQPQLERMVILKNLEPMRHYSRTEVLVLSEKGLIDDEELMIKLKFNDYIARFERENINVIEFGYKLPFSERVNKINEILKQYANESISKKRETISQQPNGGTNDGKGTN
jgi:hypothetical protein